MANDEKKKCFIITPIGDDNSVIRRHIDGIIDQAIVPAIGEKFDIKVAHREYEIGSINNRVIEQVCYSDLVIANLTGLNPNVMFEIAIRYSFGKPAIVIAEKGTKLPFDIIDENTIFYINDPAGAAELKENIRKFTEKIDWGKCEYGPVFSAIKDVTAINNIETGIKDGESRDAFLFLIKRIDELEQAIRENYSQPKRIIRFVGESGEKYTAKSTDAVMYSPEEYRLMRAMESHKRNNKKDE